LAAVALPSAMSFDEEFQLDEYGTIAEIVHPMEAPAPPSMGHDRIKRMFHDFVRQDSGQTSRSDGSLPSRAASSATRSLRTGEGGRHPVSRRPLCLVPTADLLLSNEKPTKPMVRPIASSGDDLAPLASTTVARVMDAVRSCHRRALPHLSPAASPNGTRHDTGARCTSAIDCSSPCPAPKRRAATQGDAEPTLESVVAEVMRRVRVCHRNPHPHLPQP